MLVKSMAADRASVLADDLTLGSGTENKGTPIQGLRDRHLDSFFPEDGVSPPVDRIIDTRLTWSLD